MFGYYTDSELSEIGFGSLGRNVMISRAVEIANSSKIFIGDNVRIDTFVIIAPSGDAEIRIGDFVQICAFTILNGLASITLEDFSSVGLHCSILSSSENFDGKSLTNATIEKEYLGTFSAPVMIGKHVVIATGTTVLPGVIVAEGTVVGAHSLLRESTEPFTVVAGIPAKLIRERSHQILDIEKGFLKHTIKSGE